MHRRAGANERTAAVAAARVCKGSRTLPCDTPLSASAARALAPLAALCFASLVTQAAAAQQPNEGEDAAKGLAEIKLADRSFEASHRIGTSATRAGHTAV